MPALPLYDENDAKHALELLVPVPNDGNAVDVCDGFRASFQVAGHILGASLVLVEMAGGGKGRQRHQVLVLGRSGALRPADRERSRHRRRRAII